MRWWLCVASPSETTGAPRLGWFTSSGVGETSTGGEVGRVSSDLGAFSCVSLSFVVSGDGLSDGGFCGGGNGNVAGAPMRGLGLG